MKNKSRISILVLVLVIVFMAIGGLIAFWQNDEGSHKGNDGVSNGEIKASKSSNENDLKPVTVPTPQPTTKPTTQPNTKVKNIKPLQDPNVSKIDKSLEPIPLEDLGAIPDKNTTSDK